MPYDDLIKAQRVLRAAPSLVSVLVTQSNALFEGTASESVISTDFAHIAVSYKDLAEGFVQLATGRFADDAVGVGVSSQRAKRPELYVPFALGKVFRGLLLLRFVPGYWKAEYAVSGCVGRW